jgi:hypothetical protein
LPGWDGVAWKIAALQNDTRITGRLVTAFPDLPARPAAACFLV